VETFRIYYPGHKAPTYSDSVNKHNTVKITLNTASIDPETLTGLVQNISALGADQLPNVFRFWKEEIKESGDTLNDFLRYFTDPNKNREYDTMNSRGEHGLIKMFAATSLTRMSSTRQISSSRERCPWWMSPLRVDLDLERCF
jgi:hypothetical protein